MHILSFDQVKRSVSRDSQYLDQQPALASVVTEWLSSLDIDKDVAYGSGELEPIECRSRDGFIRHSWNYGGFDLVCTSDVNACVGSGGGPDLPGIEATADTGYKAAAADFSRKYAEVLSDLGIENGNVNYHTLYQAGASELAEELSEMEYEWMSVPVRWGVRVMYHGVDSDGVHSLTVFASGNVSEYYSAFGKGSTDLAEHCLSFSGPEDLKRQLSDLQSDIESAF